MSENDETTKRLSPEASKEVGHTIEDVFQLVVSMNDRLIRLEDRFEAHRAEFLEFRDKVDSRLLKLTTPLSETLETIRVEVRQVGERQDSFAARQEAFAVELADLKRIVRKIDHKLGGLSSDMYDIKADLRDHEGRLEALEPQ
ncbi:MAG: hypothetical protein DMF74_21715 [Acidobacteria bacterium]|nr:MAG: hypothetical protein DMF74_21715 [Acidobacteriota bacterium]